MVSSQCRFPWKLVRDGKEGRTNGDREVYLAGPEPRFDFGGGSFEGVHTAPSGVKIRAVGLWLIRGDTTAGIEVCMPVTVGQPVCPKSIFRVTVQSQQRRREIAYPV